MINIATMPWNAARINVLQKNKRYSVSANFRLELIIEPSAAIEVFIFWTLVEREENMDQT